MMAPKVAVPIPPIVKSPTHHFLPMRACGRARGKNVLPLCRSGFGASVDDLAGTVVEK